ncbi:MAG: hypothetical protein ACRDMY_09415, partial [Gaiellaceae bacterium]
MTEPNAVAEGAEEVLPGVWRWGVTNERIGGAESTWRPGDRPRPWPPGTRRGRDATLSPGLDRLVLEPE